MKCYWHDFENYSDEYYGLSVHVEGFNSTSAFKITTGNNSRIKMTHHGKTIFWATIASDYQGVWFLKTATPILPEEMPIAPIRSNQVEELYSENRTQRLRNWCTFFAEQLSTSSNSVLFDGQWMLGTYKTTNNSVWNYCSTSTSVWTCKEVLSVKNSLIAANPFWNNWDMWDAPVLPVKQTPMEHEGRVKWWRKISKQGKMPPILLWYITGIEACIIIDGHSRLYASILENKCPDIIVLFPYNENERYVQTEDIKQKIVRSLEKQLAKPNPKSVNEVNRVLIETYDNRFEISAKTKAIAVEEFDDIWTKEVTTHLASLNWPENSDKMIQRNSK